MRAQAGEGSQGVALPSRGDQRAHQHGDGALAQRFGRQQRLELGDGLGHPTRREQRLRVLLGCAGPQFGQPGDLGGQRGMVELRVRAAPP